MITFIYRVNDIHCVGCVNRIKQAVMNQGALSVEINLENHTAIVRSSEDNNENVYLQAIQSLGYEAELLSSYHMEDAE